MAGPGEELDPGLIRSEERGTEARARDTSSPQCTTTISESALATFSHISATARPSQSAARLQISS